MSAEWSEQGPNHQNICPAGGQIPCWYNNLIKGEEGGHKYQDKEASDHVWWFSSKVQHPEAVRQVKRGRPRTSQHQSYSPTQNTESPGIHQEDGLNDLPAKCMTILPPFHGSINHNCTPIQGMMGSIKYPMGFLLRTIESQAPQPKSVALITELFSSSIHHLLDS